MIMRPVYEQIFCCTTAKSWTHLLAPQMELIKLNVSHVHYYREHMLILYQAQMFTVLDLLQSITHSSIYSLLNPLSFPVDLIATILNIAIKIKSLPRHKFCIGFCILKWITILIAPTHCIWSDGDVRFLQKKNWFLRRNSRKPGKYPLID